MIVRIHFNNHDPMMFGDSYKKWDDQAREFFYGKQNLLDGIILIEKCKDKWIGWGGLKWCPEIMFQEMLNREGVQQDQDDNPNARQYMGMKFVEDTKLIKKIKR